MQLKIVKFYYSIFIIHNHGTRDFLFTQHYEKDADGLCTQLKKPVAKKGNLDYSVDRQAFFDQGWVIPSKDLKLGEAIGKGEFGGNLPSFWIYIKNLSPT